MLLIHKNPMFFFFVSFIFTTFAHSIEDMTLKVK